jgi:anti-sigma regulatory factor (Ser/Thr protein kinase)
MQEEKTVRLKAILKNVPLAMECAERAARAAGFEEPALGQIQLAVDEACANVVDHAYAGMEPGDMEVTCCLDEQDFVIRIRDWGKSFDPDKVPVPDVNAPLEERTLGGLGLFLMRQVMDEVQFTFDSEQGNELLMIKRVQVE